MDLDYIMDEFIPTEAATYELANFFGLFADHTRLKIITLLSLAPLCVNDICYVLGMNQSTISHQLRNLKDTDIIDCNRRGKKTVYRLSNPLAEKFLSQAVLASEKR